MDRAALLKQEVEELTDLLRHEPVFSELRDLLRDRGLDVNNLLLAGFLEDGDGYEGGVVLTSERALYQFERTDCRRQDKFTLWRRVDQVDSVLSTYPAALIAMSMV